MNDKIFIHSDVENLRYFTDKNGITAMYSRLVSYAMQGADIVKVFYDNYTARRYYETNRYTENLPVIYYFNESLFNKLNQTA